MSGSESTSPVLSLSLREKLDEAVAELEVLPTLGDLVTRLRDEGIKGHACRSDVCPLAVYLSKKVGADVEVGTRHAWLREEAADHRVELGPQVYFLRRGVDAYRWPDLLIDRVIG